MVATADNLNEQLAYLKPEELREVLARASALLNPTGEIKPESDSDISLVGTELVAALRKAGTPKCLPLSVLLGTQYGRKLKQGAKALLEYVRENFNTKNRHEEVKVVRLFFQLAVADLQERRHPVPVGVRTLCQQMIDVHKVVDRHFPGYRVSGLLPILVKRTVQTTH